MAGTMKPLRNTQIARETANGTIIAAKDRLLGDVKFTDASTLKQVEYPLGSMTQGAGKSVITSLLSNIDVTCTPTFEQLLYFMLMSVLGDVAGVGGPPVVWTFLAPEALNPDVDAFTIEGYVTDGATPVGIVVPYCFCTDWVLSGGLNDLEKFTAKLVGNGMATHTMTPAITVPTCEEMLSNMAKLYIDDSWATLGSTPVAQVIYDHNLHWIPGLTPGFREDGGLNFTKVNWGAHGAELKITAEFGASVQAERAKAASRALRFVRLEIDGATTSKVVFDMCVQHKVRDFWWMANQGENDTVALDFMPAFDPTSSKHFQAAITNGLAKLPGEV